MSLALSSLGAGPTEQKVLKRLKRQVGLLSRRKKIVPPFLECRAAPYFIVAPSYIAEELVALAVIVVRKRERQDEKELSRSLNHAPPGPVP